MINFITVKQSGKVCARCTIIFDKGGETCDLCDDVMIKEQMLVSYKKLSKKSMIHPMKQTMQVL
jgi:hypothetical protein